MPRQESKKKKPDNIEKRYVITVLIIVLLIIAVLVYIYANFTNKTEDIKANNNTSVQQEYLQADLSWKDPIQHFSSDQRFQPCPDKNSLGKIWVNLSIINQENSLEFTCTDLLLGEVKGEIKPIDSSIQWNFGTSRNKQGFAAYAGELKKEQIVEVCCHTGNNQVNFCKNFTIGSYC